MMTRKVRIVDIGPRDMFCYGSLIGRTGAWRHETSDGEWNSGMMWFDENGEHLYFVQVKVAPLDTETDKLTKSTTDRGVSSLPKDFDNKSICYGHPDFYKILDELRDLHSRKNRDYSGDDPLSNLRMCERGGIPAWKGVIVRLTDKVSRLLSFMQKESYEVKDESVEDTLRDAAIYSILAIILYRESNRKVIVKPGGLWEKFMPKFKVGDIVCGGKQ